MDFRLSNSLPLRLVGHASETASSSGGLEQLVSEAFAEYRQPLYRYAFGLLSNAAEAEDVVQDAFLRLFEELRIGRGIDNGRSWLFQTVHNLAIDQFRKSGREEHWGDEMEGAAETATDDRLILEERQREVAARLCLLTLQERRCIELRAEGLRYREIARLLDIAVPSVQTYLARAIRKLGGRRHEA